MPGRTPEVMSDELEKQRLGDGLGEGSAGGQCAPGLEIG